MDSLKPAVAVLLSTYNGEAFLKEQLKSVFGQKDVQLALFVRDDGSGDGTPGILEEYGDGIRLAKGSNVGVGCSFMELVYMAGTGFDYYAFCDQDDIWLENKLSAAIKMIKDSGITGPALYCSNQMLVDENGNETGLRHTGKVENSYLQILNSNKATGCTMVWNKPLQELLFEEKRRPSAEILKKRIHDVWVAMVASVTGSILYDENAYILYRQHENNVVGSEGTSTLTEWKRKMKDASLRNGRSGLAKEILDKYSDVIPDENIIENLRDYADYRENKARRKKLLKYGEIPKYTGEGKNSLKLKIMLRLL